MTVTLLLVVALMQIFNAAASTWQHGEAQVDAYREARGAMQLMARDLSATLQASYNQTGITTAANYAPALPTLALQRYADPTPDGTGPTNEEVYCLTNIPNPGASSLCAVGLFLPVDARHKPRITNCPQAYALMRQALDSDKTFTQIKTATAAGKNPLTFNDFFHAEFAWTSNAVPSPVQLAAFIWDLRFRIDTDLNDDASHTPDGNAPDAPKDHSTPNVRYYRGDGSATQPYPPRLPTLRGNPFQSPERNRRAPPGGCQHRRDQGHLERHGLRLYQHGSLSHDHPAQRPAVRPAGPAHQCHSLVSTP